MSGGTVYLYQWTHNGEPVKNAPHPYAFMTENAAGEWPQWVKVCTLSEALAATAMREAAAALATYVDGYEYGQRWRGRPHKEMGAVREALSLARGEK